jgi:hypothetical protein
LRRIVIILALAILLTIEANADSSMIELSKHQWGVDIRNTTDDVVYAGICMWSSTCGHDHMNFTEAECKKARNLNDPESWKFYSRLKWIRIEAGDFEGVPGCGCRGASVSTWGCSFTVQLKIKSEETWQEAQRIFRGEELPPGARRQETKRSQLPANSQEYESNTLITDEPCSAMTQALRHATSWPWGRPESDIPPFFKPTHVMYSSKAHERGRLVNLWFQEPDSDINVVDFHYEEGLLHKMVIKHPAKLPLSHTYVKAKNPLQKKYISHDQADFCKFMTNQWQEIMGGPRFEFAERLEHTIDGVKYDMTFDCDGWIVLTMTKEIPKRNHHLRQAFTIPDMAYTEGWEFLTMTSAPNDLLILRKWPGDMTLHRKIDQGRSDSGIAGYWSKEDFLRNTVQRIEEQGYTYNTNVANVWELSIDGHPVWYTEGFLSKKGDAFYYQFYTAYIKGARYDIEFYIENGHPDMQSTVKTGREIIKNLKLNTY